MTSLQFLGGGLGLTYLVGAVWFLLFERKAGFTLWRVLATVFSPLTVPLLAVLGLLLLGVDKFFGKKEPVSIGADKPTDKPVP